MPRKPIHVMPQEGSGVGREIGRGQKMTLAGDHPGATVSIQEGKDLADALRGQRSSLFEEALS